MRDGEVRIRDGVSWRDVNGEVVALDLESSSYFSTNRTGTMMWKALVEGASRQSLIELLHADYGISSEVAAADVDGFVALLRQHGLVDGDT